MTQDRIVAAAIKFDGFIASVEKPGRHHDILNNLATTGFPTPIVGRQGFLTSRGEFVGRKLAMQLAVNASQLIPRQGQHGPDGDLFSEDVW